MLKKLLALGCLAACVALFTGCDKAASATSGATSAAVDKTKEAAKEMAEKVTKVKDEVTKSIDVGALETKINGLAGDAKTSALAKLGDLKKMIEEFKGLSDLTKVTEMKEKLMTLYAEVKKMAGL